MQLLINAGRLVSTTDMKLARNLREVVAVKDILGGKMPEGLRQTKKAISFMLNGELYELEAV
jgi:hypothetical protein